MGNYYVVYDKKSGDILQTYSKYSLGTDEPVACNEEEILAFLEKTEEGVEPAVVKAPDDFDPRARDRRLTVDQSGELVVRERKLPERQTKSRH